MLGMCVSPPQQRSGREFASQVGLQTILDLLKNNDIAASANAWWWGQGAAWNEVEWEIALFVGFDGE